MTTRVSETLYFVRDFAAAIDFYVHRLGFRVVAREDWGFAVLDLDGSARLGLMDAKVWDSGVARVAGLPTPRVAFRTDRIEEEVERLRGAGVVVSDLAGEPGTLRAVHVLDPDGNAFFLWDDGCAVG